MFGPVEPPGWREYLSDESLLSAALDEAQRSTVPGWHLAIAAYHMLTSRRFADALRVYDAIIERPHLELSAYNNALWVVQHDNTGLPVDEARARRYLAHAVRHAPMNPSIFLVAAGVKLELGEVDAAFENLVLAARRVVPLQDDLTRALLEPIRRHPRWPELEREAEPLRWAEPDPTQLCRELTPGAMVERLVTAFEDPDPRVAHRGLRQLVWWRDEDGNDGHGGRAHPALLGWYEAVGAAIGERVTTARVGDVIGRDLRGPYAYEAAYSLDVLARNHAWEDVGAVFDPLGPSIAAALGEGDDAVVDNLLDALTWRRSDEARRRSIVQLVPAVVAVVDTVAAGPGLSDVARVKLDHLRHAVEVLAQLDALEVSKPALAQIVERARGEVWDRHLREELRRRLV
jgi:hypothetical protein